MSKRSRAGSGTSASSVSAVWDFFVPDTNDKAVVICNECQNKIRRGGTDTKSFGTSSLWKHLKSAHNEEYEMGKYKYNYISTIILIQFSKNRCLVQMPVPPTKSTLL